MENANKLDDKPAALPDASISSLHLEPNPFEQSFATTKKPQENESMLKSGESNNLVANNSLSPTLNLPTASIFSPGSNGMNTFINNNINSGTTSATNGNNNHNISNTNINGNNNVNSNGENVRPLLMNKISSISISDLTTQLNDDKVNKPSNNIDNNNKSNNNNNNTNTENKIKPPNLFSSGSFTQHFFFSQQQKPNIMSPGALTPGGSKKLPPLLSPNFMIPTNNISTNTSSNSNNISNNNGGNGFLSYLPRSGLTPNESNMRSGLTPGSVFPLLPTIDIMNSNNANNNNAHSSKGLNKTSLESMGPFTPSINGILTLPNMDNNVNGNHHSKSNNQTDISNSTINNTVSNTASNTVSNTQSGNQSNVVSPMIAPIESPMSNNVSSNSSGTINKIIKTENVTITKNNKRKLNETFPTSSNVSFTSTIDMKPIRKYKRKLNTTNNTKSITQKNDTTQADSSVDNRGNDKKPLIPEDEDERKRKEFLERNRVAASKFRKRKKEYISKIENYIQIYEREYNELSSVMAPICGFQQNNNGTNFESSLLHQIENSIQKNDLVGAMNIINHMKNLLSETNYYRRNGTAPVDPEPVEFNNENNDTMEQSKK